MPEPRPAPHIRLLTLLLLLPAAACTGPESAARAGGGTVARWTAGAPTVRIGSLDTGPAALSPVDDLAFGPGGAAYVLQAQDAQVRVFGPDGAFRRTVGRRGEGPGELQRPRALGFFGDTLWVHDPGLRRVSLYDTLGTPLADRPEPRATDVAEGLTAQFRLPWGDGGALFRTAPIFTPANLGDYRMLMARPTPLLGRRTDGAPLDTLALLDQAHEQAMIVDVSGGRIVSVMIFPQPWADATLWDVAEDGSGMVLVDRRVAMKGRDAESPSWGLRRVDVAGRTVFAVQVPWEPLPLPAAEADSMVEAETRGSLTRAQVEEAFFLPDVRPAATAVVAGVDGTAWVAREAVPGHDRTWEVFGPDGVLLGRVDLPERLTVYRADPEGVWGVLTDDLDVPWVVRIPVDRTPG